MVYRLNVSTIGEKVKEVLDRNQSELYIRQVFSNTLYIEAGGDMGIITRKGNRSPITINIPQDSPLTSFHQYVKIGDKIEASESRIRFGELEIDLKNADYYTQPKIDRIKNIDDTLEKIYLKGLNFVILLYSTSPTNLSLLELGKFKEFLEKLVYPLSRGDLEVVKNSENYRLLLGTGEGFTPSGDDFLLGFISILNIFDERFQIPRIILEDEILFKHTTWVSAMFLKYAQQENYDENVHQVLNTMSSRDEAGFVDFLLQLARRGHTSGLDISLGILTGLASIIDNFKNRRLSDKLIEYVLNLN